MKRIVEDLPGGAAMSFEEIAARLGMNSGQHACQVYRRAIEKIRRNPKAMATFRALLEVLEVERAARQRSA